MTLEPDMAIICACLPVMRPLVTMLIASQFYRSIASYLSTVTGTGTGTGSSAKNSKRAASNAIGGLSSSAAASSAARRDLRGDNRASTFGASGYALSSFDSLEYLRDEDMEAARVRPSQGDNSNIGCQTRVSISRSVGPEEIPLGAIAVKTVFDCRETTL
jgi:hypothetical protein